MQDVGNLVEARIGDGRGVGQVAADHLAVSPQGSKIGRDDPPQRPPYPRLRCFLRVAPHEEKYPASGLALEQGRRGRPADKPRRPGDEDRGKAHGRSASRITEDSPLETGYELSRQGSSGFSREQRLAGTDHTAAPTASTGSVARAVLSRRDVPPVALAGTSPL